MKKIKTSFLFRLNWWGKAFPLGCGLSDLRHTPICGGSLPPQRPRFFVPVFALFVSIFFVGCVPDLINGPAAKPSMGLPDHFEGIDAITTTPSSAELPWNEFFVEPELRDLIDKALLQNQEYKIVALELDIAQAEVLARKGELFPKLGFKGGVGLARNGGLTSSGVSDAAHNVPDHLGDFSLGLNVSWEADIWGKLQNATKAAASRYLSSVEGKKFAATTLISEIAMGYYELKSLDVQLSILKENIQLQTDSLAVVKMQKEAARVTELAVKRFESELMKNESRQFVIQQSIVEIENKLNFLVGRLPQHIARNTDDFVNAKPTDVSTGLPAKLLENRPDIRQAELALAATGFDVASARAAFFPTLGINISGGYQAYDLLQLFATPLSLFYALGAETMGPLLNRAAITTAYNVANAKQKQAVANYERAILNGYVEAATQVSAIENVNQSFALRAKEVELLKESSTIASSLFASSRADYLEVLTIRRDVLESNMELVELKKQRLLAMIQLYQALGGGWRTKAPQGEPPTPPK
jgi:outer membrane protein, multidrug efflux system